MRAAYASVRYGGRTFGEPGQLRPSLARYLFDDWPETLFRNVQSDLRPPLPSCLFDDLPETFFRDVQSDGQQFQLF